MAAWNTYKEPTPEERVRNEKIEKVTDALFYHFNKHKVSASEAMACVGLAYSMILNQCPIDERDILADSFKKIIAPCVPPDTGTPGIEAK